MDTIRFSATTLVCFGISGVLMTLLAVTAFLLWRKRTLAPMKPIIVGMIVFPLFALLLKIPAAYPFLMADTELAHTVSGNLWLSFLTAGVLAGVLEETGRFLAFKTVLKHYGTRRTAISYGIGHGGFECLYIAYTMLSMIVLGFLVNRGMLPEMTKNLTPAQLDTALKQLQEYASQGPAETLLGFIERLGALCLQTGLSVLVFRAAREQRSLWLFPAAMLLHMWIDFSIVFYRNGTFSAPVFELLFLAQAAVILLLALCVVYPKLPKTGKEGIA